MGVLREQPLVGWIPGLSDPAVASLRLRAALPARHLARAGYRTAIIHDDASAAACDCVVFQKAYSEENLALATRLRDRGVRVVFDLCDNHSYNPEGIPWIAERAERLRRMIDQADVVTVASPELLPLVGSKPAFVVDDALEVPSLGPLVRGWRRAVHRGARHEGPVRVVWFGNHGVKREFGLAHLGSILPQLERLADRRPVRLTVISNSREAFDEHISATTLATRYVAWHPRSFARRFSNHDVCLIPVELNPLTVAKTSNRLVLSLMLGVPVVASELPSYRPFADVVRFGDWETNVEAYANDAALARRHVERGQALVRARYTPDHLVQQWDTALQAALAAD